MSRRTARMSRCSFLNVLIASGKAFENGYIETKKVCLKAKTLLFFCFLLFQTTRFFFIFFESLFLHQLAVATLLDLCISKAARLVDFVLRIAALEEEDLTIALEGKNVGTDTVEEPAVVADNHSTTGKCLQTFLQGTQRVHVDIVGWLIEEQCVPPASMPMPTADGCAHHPREHCQACSGRCLRS